MPPNAIMASWGKTKQKFSSVLIFSSESERASQLQCSLESGAFGSRPELSWLIRHEPQP